MVIDADAITLFFLKRKCVLIVMIHNDHIPIVIKINTPSTVKDNPEPSKADADVNYDHLVHIHVNPRINIPQSKQVRRLSLNNAGGTFSLCCKDNFKFHSVLL